MKLIIKLLSFSIFFLSLNVIAQDRTFAWTYNTTVLSKGLKDLEAWSTYGAGRNYFYNRLDTRLEMEVGLTDRLQTALYFNASHVTTAPNLDTLGGIADTSMTGLFSGSEFSMSSEWKWKLSDPVANKVGFTLYGELGYSSSGLELEQKFIFDKKIGNHVLALNLVSELEYEFEVTKTERELELEALEEEIDLGYMYMCKPNKGIGFELRNHNEIEGGSAWQFSALFGGPTYFYSGERYFLILNLMPQWTNLHKTDDAPGNLVLNEHEKFSVRLLLGFGL
jgi:hypothetical protein